MSGFAQTKVSGGRPKRDVLASLKMAQLEISKPVLPAEIMSSILEYLAPADLIRVARTSKHMQEMVYEDSRWVQRLKRMGCWNDTEARKHAEKATAHLRPRAPTIEVQVTPPQQPLSPKKDSPVVNGNINDDSGFDKVDFSSSSQSHPGLRVDPSTSLHALKRIRSIRGKARQEYGKIHAALHPFYDDIITSEASADSLAFKVYTTPEDQAQILSQLQIFAKGDISLGGEEREQKVLDAVSLFETAALREFRSGYESGDIDGLMRKYAHVLVTLNGGGPAIELFVHHNHVITQKSDFGSPADCINRDTGIVSLEQTQAFLTRFSVGYNEEVSIMSRVFPQSIQISTQLLDTFGTNVLSPYFTALFDEVHTQNLESYLKTVSGTFVQVYTFLRKLDPPQNPGDEFYEATDAILNNIFESHVDLYLTEELEFFRHHCDEVVSEWDRQLSEQAATAESFYMSNINRQADKNDFLTSFKKVLMVPVNILPSFSSTKPSDSQLEDLAKSGTNPIRPLNPNRASTMTLSHGPFAPPIAPSTPAEAPTTELAAKAAIMHSRLEGIRSLFSIEVALDLVHAAKQSLERAGQFVNMGEQSGKAAQQQCEAIFVALLHILGQRHVISGLDKAVTHLSEYRPRQNNELERSGVDPLVTFLELVNVGDLILQMMDVFYEQELVGARLTDRNDFLNPAAKGKKKFEQMLDERVAAGLNKGIEVLMDEVDYILATKQATTDFNPEVDPTSHNVIDIGPSDPAKEIVDVISSHTQMLVGSTDKGTLEVFNQEIGLQLFAALCKHIKRQRISVQGAIKLISDMNHYFGYIETMKNDELLAYFTALRELSQVYLIDPAHSKEMATVIADGGRFHGIFRAEEVYEFATRRADWYQVKRSVERAMFGIGCTMM
ncbi:hypothetical protein AJ80_06625 [Polytolypa hystricis UAMH7299]|uniref:F-box domain-containing protein n=1 Tax=Polytolypa hystricis (strain UAMH7299) TaxID=1447883 RepID=A0A2B7XVM8_POLH7|nr:hypothetical protein AJ80_06625 [Polytolypa hystricis UAMH7299]